MLVVVLLKQKNVLFLYIYKHIFLIFLFYYFTFIFLYLAKKSIRRSKKHPLDNVGDSDLNISNKENQPRNGIISLYII